VYASFTIIIEKMKRGQKNEAKAVLEEWESRLTEARHQCLENKSAEKKAAKAAARHVGDAG
jgi:hypothetical protein